MKHYFYSFKAAATVVLCASLILGMGSCNNNPTQDVIPVDKAQESELTSEIDLMEKQEGVKYFKKDMWLKSADGKSEVLMRFAAKTQSELESYLYMHEFNIRPISDKNLPQEAIPIESTKNSGKALEQPQRSSQTIRVLCEEIETKLATGIVGFHLDVKNVAITERRNAKISAEADYYTELYSDRRPDEYRIQIYSDYVWLTMDMRESWWNPNWVVAYMGGHPNPWVKLYPNPSGQPLTWNVSSWYKARSKVHYFQLMSANFTHTFIY